MSDEDLSPEEVEALSQAMGGVSEQTVATEISRAQFMQLEDSAQIAGLPSSSIERIFDIKVEVEAILGRKKVSLEEVLKLGEGSVVELNKLAGEPVELLANGKTVALAEVVVIEDRFGIKIIEIVGAKEKLEVLQKGDDDLD